MFVLKPSLKSEDALAAWVVLDWISNEKRVPHDTDNPKEKKKNDTIVDI